MAKGIKTGGRVKGTPNKINGQVRDMILAALDGAGGKDYLVTQALQNPAIFVQLICKLLPLPAGGNDHPWPAVSSRVERVIIDPRDTGRDAA